MSFLNFALLSGLAAIAVPIILHLLNRRTAKVLDWGAMQFLLESVESRKRRIQLEEALLLAARCLVVGLLALAVARPFVPPGAVVPWGLVLPALLLGVVSVTTALVLRESRRWFWILLIAGLLLVAGALTSVWFARQWNLQRLAGGGGRDIALILDASASMQLQDPEGRTRFAAAVAAAREVVREAPAGSSFSLILGGPVPLARLPEPVVNRLEVERVLGEVQPQRGSMAAFDALAAATVSLSRGSNAGKEIVILTDGQNAGWETGKPGRWESLTAGMKLLPQAPRVLLHRFPLPVKYRNAAIAGIRFSREVIGVDRPVSIEVTVENTGQEAITPQGLDLTVEGKILKDSGMGQIPPGGRQTVRFLHQFSRPGSAVLQAKLQIVDDLAPDNEMPVVCQVIDRLGVLVVDGQGNGPFLQRPGSLMALALSPASLQAGDLRPKESATALSLDPEVVPLSRISSLTSFAPYGVVILADVPRLPESTAQRLAGWVQGGGGLLVTPGSRAAPEFYNAWKDSGGGAFLPSGLGQEIIPADPAGPALTSFTHPALGLVADSRQSDLGSALFSRYWKLEPQPGADSWTGGVLNSGDAFLCGRKAGYGSVLMTCVNFDALGSNLPSRQAFVPLVHQLVYHLASPSGQPLNQTPAVGLQLPLSRGAGDGGLLGEYFKGRQLQSPVLVRLDGRTDFNWGNDSPGPGVPSDFSARWSGMLRPRYSEEYTLDGWGDDSLSVWLDDKRLIERGGQAKILLEAGKPVPIRIEFADRSGGAAWQLSWSSQSQGREIIPAEVLAPFAQGESGSGVAVGRWPVLGPDDRPRHAEVVFTAGGLSARIQGDAVPGLYRIPVPAASRGPVKNLLSPEGDLPFTVTTDALESRLQPLDEAEMQVLRKHLDLVEVSDPISLIAALTGREFGEELWRILAVGALFLMLAEVALSRWIARSRRTGGVSAVDFETRFEPSAGFQEQLRKVQQPPAV